MCLAIPGEIVEIEGSHATVDFGGVRSKVNTILIPDVKAGDYVIVHVGFAIQKLDREEAIESLKLWEQLLKEEEGL
jgi:hydrogenase expression/formation protein HypC